MSSVTFEQGSALTTLDSAFENCTALTGIYIPKSVTSIGIYTFYGCTKLSSISFEAASQLTTIDAQAFENCTSRLLIHSFSKLSCTKSDAHSLSLMFFRRNRYSLSAYFSTISLYSLVVIYSLVHS